MPLREIDYVIGYEPKFPSRPGVSSACQGLAAYPWAGLPKLRKSKAGNLLLSAPGLNVKYILSIRFEKHAGGNIKEAGLDKCHTQMNSAYNFLGANTFGNACPASVH